MLSTTEVATYLKGLWLLFRADPKGARYLDLTDRGFRRSFLAPLVCLPALSTSWFWWAYTYQQLVGETANIDALFFIRLMMVEAICWLVPLISMAVLLLAFNAKGKFNAIVICANWLAVPFTYTYAALIFIGFFIPFLQATVALLFLGLLLALVIAYSRIIRFFIRDQALLVFAIVSVMLIPPMFLSELLQRFLGVYPM